MNPLWTPSESFKEESGLFHYQEWLKERYQLNFESYEDLWSWSVEKTEDFWTSLMVYFDIKYSGQIEHVLSGDQMPQLKWFEGINLNYAEHIFREKSNDRPALYFQNEELCQTISWSTLEDRVKSIRSFLQDQGIQKGDCIAAYLPNIPEAIYCFLAVNSLGAVWTCCSPDFGESTVIERFSQVKPKLLFAVDGYKYSAKPFNKISSVKAISDQISSIEDVIFIKYLDGQSELEGSIEWDKIISQKIQTDLNFERVDFSHPVWVLYSSGTTGKPKAITHSHGGVLLEHLKYMRFHNDVKEGEFFFWFSTTGWMMWNFLQASMLVGAVPVLYDGSPGYPNMDVLWDMADSVPIQHFGTSAPYLIACMKKELHVNERFDLSSLRSIGSTGAPLPDSCFKWIYEHIKSDLWLCSMSGGTDVCTAFIGGNPYQAVYPGYIQSRALGCALYAYNDEGFAVTDNLGEMVITKAMPSMPIYFWNDPEFKRYHSSYFEKYPGLWRHGDYISIREDGQLKIYGRSDATLNRKGVRIGTAEIYTVLNKIAGLKDALILNIELDNGDDHMPLFVVLEEGVVLDEDLKSTINSALRKHCSPRHVPDIVLNVPDVPYTLSGKKMEVPVKKLFANLGKTSSVNLEVIRNPEAMSYFIELAKKYQIT